MEVRLKYSFLLLITYLILPRIDLFSYGQGHVRIGDILVLLVFLLLITNIKLLTDLIKFYLNPYLFFFLLIGVSSYLLSLFFFEPSENPYSAQLSLTYLIRMLEFLLFYFVAKETNIREKTVKRLILLIISYQLIFAFLQYYAILPVFRATEGAIIGEGWLAGSTGGTWELVWVVAISAIYLLRNYINDKKYLIYFSLVSLIFYFLVFSGQKAVVVTFIIANLLLLASILKSTVQKFVMTLIILFFVIMGILLYLDILQLFYYKIESYLNRFIEFHEYLNRNGFIPIGKFDEFEDTNLRSARSWLMREEKWAFFILVFREFIPTSLFFGIGPGASGASLDGGILRLAIEYGVFGFSAFLFYLFKISKNNLIILVVFLLSLLFLDSYLAYIYSPFFFTILGLSCRKRKK